MHVRSTRSSSSSSSGPRSARAGRRAQVLVVAAALAAGLLGSAPPVAAATAITPPAVPALTPTTAPASPVSVPGYADARLRSLRVSPGSGVVDTTFEVGNGGGYALWGDWDGDGAATPATFLNGRWTIYAAAVSRPGYAPPVLRAFSFGLPGDIPVVGDWNGDGSTDIGVYHRGWWVERFRATAGPTHRKFRFGTPTDVPVVGDWDGDGKDNPGLRRGGQFLLTNRINGTARPIGAVPTMSNLVMPGASVRRISFGSATDTAVAGDWDGDGKDGIGVVRASTWWLRDSTALPTRRTITTKRVVPRPAGSVPLPWSTTAGATAAACPTAPTAAVARGDSAAAFVVPPSGLHQSRANGTAASLVRRTVINAEHFQLGARWQELYAARTSERYLDLLGDNKTTEFAIRGPANSAVTLAIGLTTDAFDSTTIGVPAATARAQAGWLIRSIACQHGGLTPGGWAYGWQTAHWANIAGEAAWLLWDDPVAMPPQVKGYVAGMVEAEADNLLTAPPAFWKDPSGVVAPGRIGNTAAEEDAWNGALLAFAAEMMPGHPHAALWRQQAAVYGVAAFMTPNDLVSGQVVNGISTAAMPGTNVNGDGTVVNHGSVDPDYMAAAQHLWWSAVFSRLAGSATYPRAYTFNGSLIYGAMTTRVFDPTVPNEDGNYWAQPGGTIYQNGGVYFPAVHDWGTTRKASWVAFDANASYLGLDGTGAVPAADLLVQHAAAALDLQNRFGDGRSYAPVVPGVVPEDTYYGAEEYAAHQLSFAWMALYLGTHAPVAAHDLPVTVPAPAGGKKLAAPLTRGQLPYLKGVAPVPAPQRLSP